MENNEKKLYYVTDLYLAAYLMIDFKLVKIEVFEREDRNKVDFFFEDSKELRLAKKDFMENEFLTQYKNNLKSARIMMAKALRGEMVE